MPATKPMSIVMTAEEVRMLPNKTQHRIPVKLRPDQSVYGGGKVHPAVEAITDRGDGWFGFDAPKRIMDQYISTFPLFTIRCPFQPGDVVYVKEAYYVDDGDYLSGRMPIERPASFDDDSVYYPADATGGGSWCCQLIPECCCCEVGKPRIRSAVGMPPWLARHWLRIKSVGVQRVQEISRQDAEAEGVEPDKNYTENPLGAFYKFRYVWDAKHGPGSWDSNPWVFVLSFERIEKPQS